MESSAAKGNASAVEM